MFDRVLTLLLLFGLIACPARCALGAAAVQTSDSQIAAVCSCCQHDGANSGDEGASGTPESDPEGCECTSCLCEGAISGGVSHRDLADDLLTPTAADFITPAQLLSAAVSSNAPEWGLGAPPTGWNHTGRETRIAHQSFLL